MTCANKALLVVMVVATLGLWGCAQNPSGTATSARIRDLESRIARLEEDYRVVVTARDQYKRKLVSAEERSAQQADQLKTVARERDELKQQVNARGAERDALQNQLIQLGKDLQSLAVRIESATGTPLTAPPATSALAAPSGGES
jgi:septal ring factor EnvC (AmiA/AmiB activator)